MGDHRPGCVCVECEAHAERARIDALEAYVREHGVLVIHLGDAECGLLPGLAFGGPNTNHRSLRGALDRLRAASKP